MCYTNTGQPAFGETGLFYRKPALVPSFINAKEHKEDFHFCNKKQRVKATFGDFFFNFWPQLHHLVVRWEVSLCIYSSLLLRVSVI